MVQSSGIPISNQIFTNSSHSRRKQCVSFLAAMTANSRPPLTLPHLARVRSSARHCIEYVKFLYFLINSSRFTLWSSYINFSNATSKRSHRDLNISPFLRLPIYSNTVSLPKQLKNGTRYPEILVCYRLMNFCEPVTAIDVNVYVVLCFIYVQSHFFL